MQHRNPWLAIDVRTDPVRHAREVRRAWERFVNDAAASSVREPIAESWRRCAAAGVPPSGALQATEDAGALWTEHPLRAVVPYVREALAEIAEEAQHLIAIADADGRVLWMEGPGPLRARAADEMAFTEGVVWSEQAGGTNGIGTAIAVDHALQVFAGEHFLEAAQRWTCVAAPIHDPASGRLLGVIDVSGRLETAHPHSLALAVSAARAVEAELRAAQSELDATLCERHVDRVIRSTSAQRALVGPDGRVLLSEPRAWAPPSVEVPAGGGDVLLPGDIPAVAEALGPDGSFLLRTDESRRPRAGPALTLVTLGRGRGLVRLARRRLELRHRHTEMLVLLASRREGMSAGELALALYGDDGRPSTVRTEMCRLRELLGQRIETAPYRLSIPVDADFLDVQRRLRAGAPLEAAQRYHAPLLPHSDAPGIVDLRDELDGWMRRAVLASDDAETLWAWLQSASGQADVGAWKRFLAEVDFRDPRRALAASRVAALRASDL